MTLELVAYGTLNIANKEVLVNISADTDPVSGDVSFGTMTEYNTTIYVANHIGGFSKIENRYFNNITEFFTVE